MREQLVPWIKHCCVWVVISPVLVGNESFLGERGLRTLAKVKLEEMKWSIRNTHICCSSFVTIYLIPLRQTSNLQMWFVLSGGRYFLRITILCCLMYVISASHSEFEYNIETGDVCSALTYTANPSCFLSLLSVLNMAYLGACWIGPSIVTTWQPIYSKFYI